LGISVPAFAADAAAHRRSATLAARIRQSQVMTEAIRFVLNGRHTQVRDRPATMTLLDWLRLDARLTGTKEGCAEGDCGACTVVLERLDRDGTVTRRAANSCITMLGQADGLGVRTAEGVQAADGKLHPIQSALMKSGGTQCGFCTPGFVMAGYAFLADRGGARDLSSIHDALAGNLCRCTGYRPIVAAMQDATAELRSGDDPGARELGAALASAARAGDVAFDQGGTVFFAPRSFDSALELRARHPDAVILTGGTDIGLLVSQKRQTIATVIHLANIGRLRQIEHRDGLLTIGAAATYTDALELLAERHPTLRRYLTRLGSRQIRNMGTLGGNLGTASPIGDALPVLLALDAKIRVASAARASRDIPVDTFFTGYRRTALAGDELIEALLIPDAPPDASLFAYKISKRRDQDISTVCAAFNVRSRGDVVSDVRLAFGGMAPTPKRASNAEALLRGRQLTLDAVTAAAEALELDFVPISDWRGSAEYRLRVAQNLVERLYWQAAVPSMPTDIEELTA
jgi:xanthine dehydrogenase small subunit